MSVARRTGLRKDWRRLDAFRAFAEKRPVSVACPQGGAAQVSPAAASPGLLVGVNVPVCVKLRPAPGKIRRGRPLRPLREHTGHSGETPRGRSAGGSSPQLAAAIRAQARRSAPATASRVLSALRGTLNAPHGPRASWRREGYDPSGLGEGSGGGVDRQQQRPGSRAAHPQPRGDAARRHGRKEASRAARQRRGNAHSSNRPGALVAPPYQGRPSRKKPHRRRQDVPRKAPRVPAEARQALGTARRAWLRRLRGSPGLFHGSGHLPTILAIY
jgi:hypothetical protein